MKKENLVTAMLRYKICLSFSIFHTASIVNVVNKDTRTCHCEGDSPKQSLQFGLLHFAHNDNFLLAFTITYSKKLKRKFLRDTSML